MDIDHPFLEAYLDSCILLEPREYNHLSVWSLSVGEYVSRSAKESNFKSPLHRFMHRLIVFIIHHHEEHDKVLQATFSRCGAFFILIFTSTSLILLFPSFPPVMLWALSHVARYVVSILLVAWLGPMVLILMG